ncbi:MAG: hypothetical protein RMK29_06730 [Myxococcales bacterium]|nr:hypothetical protein [Myxococcota bacterium]MDW8281389.1 hypothetical protein [Myxococcales bacterium]
MWLLSLLCACGVGGGGAELRVESGPQSGLGPFRLLLAAEAPALDAPFVLLAPGLEVAEPAAVADGAQLRLWVSVRPRQGVPFIAEATVPRLEEGASELMPVLLPHAPWEQSGLGRPALVRGEPGLPRYVLFYQAEHGDVGAAVSEDGHGFWQLPVPLLPAAAIGGARGLGGLVTAQELHLFLVRGEVELVRARASVAEVARALGGGPPPGWQVGSLGLAAVDFVVPGSGTETVPGERILSVSARAVQTPAGRRRYDLFVTVGAGPRRALCAASSYDGRQYLVVPTPLLGRPGGQLQGGTVLLYRQRALLLVGLTTTRSGIAAGLIP